MPEPAFHIDFSYWASRSVLVTGAAGTIGSGVVRELLLAGAQSIVCVDRAETAMAELQDFLSAQCSHTHSLYLAGIEDEQKLTQIFSAEKPDVVIHCAAYKHVPFLENHPAEAIENNFFATKMLADLAAKSGVDKFITISTDKAVEPANVMGFTKRLAELEMRYRNLGGTGTKFLSVRFGNVMGSNGSFSRMLESRLQPGVEIKITGPEVSRYMMSAKEACSLVLHVAETGNGGDTFVYDMGEPVKIIDLLDELLAIKGIARESIAVSFCGLRPGDKQTEQLFYEFEKQHSKREGKVWRITIPGILMAEVSLLRQFAEKRIRTFVSHDLFAELSADLEKYSRLSVSKFVPSPE